ncbi:MAG TPA: hypothetical protein VGL63_09265 [Streptosporangiaceae bacterium]
MRWMSGLEGGKKGPGNPGGRVAGLAGGSGPDGAAAPDPAGTEPAQPGGAGRSGERRTGRAAGISSAGERGQAGPGAGPAGADHRLGDRAAGPGGGRRLGGGRGKPEHAAELFGCAATAWAALPRPCEALLAGERRGHCLLAARRHEAGLAALCDAFRGLSRLPARGDAVRVMVALRELGMDVEGPRYGEPPGRAGPEPTAPRRSG